MGKQCAELAGARNTLRPWFDGKETEGIASYQQDRNQTTLPGLPTQVIA